MKSSQDYYFFKETLVTTICFDSYTKTKNNIQNTNYKDRLIKEGTYGKDDTIQKMK